MTHIGVTSAKRLQAHAAHLHAGPATHTLIPLLSLSHLTNERLTDALHPLQLQLAQVMLMQLLQSVCSCLATLLTASLLLRVSHDPAHVSQEEDLSGPG